MSEKIVEEKPEIKIINLLDESESNENSGGCCGGSCQA